MNKSLLRAFNAFKFTNSLNEFSRSKAGSREISSRNLLYGPKTLSLGNTSSLNCKGRLRLQPAPLQSILSHSVAAFFFLATTTAVVYWAFCVKTTDPFKSPSSKIQRIMSTSEVLPGHLGNLSAEQEKKLRDFWQEVGKVTGSFANEDSAAEETNQQVAASETSHEQKGGGWGLGMFRRGESGGSGSIEDDKFGLNKQYAEILDQQSPESIRATMWGMAKHDHPDALALRFLRARKWDVQKALVMFITTIHWRKAEVGVDDDVMKNGEAGAARDEKNGSGENKQLGSDFLAQLRMGKSFIHGADKENRPICLVRVRLHRGGEQSPESIERYTVHVIETARLFLKPPVETATVIFDMTSFTLANMDYAPVKFMIRCFEANYPESLGAVLIHNAPWLFQGIWRIIRGWLDPVVASKIHFTNGRSGLEEYIEPSKILKELGGDEDWEYTYIEPGENENSLMEDAATRDAILKDRAALVDNFEKATKLWLQGGDGEPGKQARERRHAIASQLKDNYWKLDPYIRARSLYDRQGVISPGGVINYYPRRGN